MGSYKAIVDELLLVAIGNDEGKTGFSAIKSADNEQLASVNYDNRAKEYPFLLIDKDYTRRGNRALQNNYLPKQNRFTIRLHFLDTHLEDERKTKSIEEKQNDLHLIADQYMAEIIRRTFEVHNDFQVIDFDSIEGFGSDKVHNDKLAQYTITVQFLAENSCTLGTFDL